MKKTKIVIFLLALLGNISCAYSMLPGGPGADVSLPTFASWCADQRATDIPAELITEEQYAQTMRKQVEGEYPGAHIPKYRNFIPEAQDDGHEKIDAYKIYLQRQIVALKQLKQEQELPADEGKFEPQDFSSVRARLLAPSRQSPNPWSMFKFQEFIRGKKDPADETFQEAHTRTKGKVALPKQGTTLYALTLTRKHYPIEIQPLTTLNDIRKQISDQSGVPASQYRLIMEGKLINNMDDFSTWEEGIIHVVPKKY